MSLLNVGARALQANQAALQTTGHNIANVNTVGYSRQGVALQAVPGQNMGNGYIGKGVDVQSILRSHSDLLTRQATAASAVDASDAVRVERLRQLQDVFSGGATGLGSAISDMVNAFSGVVTAPTDLTARNVVLTRMDETAKRMRGASERIEDIAAAVGEQVQGSLKNANALAQSIAALNGQISQARGNGQPANDLLDQRDQLVRNLNQHIQTTQVAADDGSITLFVGSSQPLVMGSTAAQLSAAAGTDGMLRLYFQQPGAAGAAIELREDMLGGGDVAGLMKFQNHDLAEGRNLLGRMALGISEALNTQNRLGLTLDGAPGGNLFAPIALPNALPGKGNPSTAQMGLSVGDPSKLQASGYSVAFTAAAVGTVTRASDGVVMAFGGPAASLDDVMAGEGLKLHNGAVPSAAFLGAAANDTFQLNPLQGAAAQLQALQFSPRQLAAANPVNANMGVGNDGTLQLAGLKALSNPLTPAMAPVTLTFTGPNSYTRSDDPAVPPALPTPHSYASGQPIGYDAGPPASGWSITLNGAPKTGDTVTVGNAADTTQYGDWYTRDAGNAGALLALRDAKLFDGAALSDGFASAMAQVGTRTQSAQFAAALSSSMAANLERDRSAVSGVNLDEEAARLIQYQQAYQASAKMLQIAQNIFDNLLQTVGR